jgi:putative CocE/NonD family hydrolase
VRGRGDSDGVFTPWDDDFNDGYDTVEWVAGQPWCDGRVGMLGGSYMAWVQWTAAARRPPHLVTMVAAGSPGRWGRDWPYRDGAFWAEDYLEWLYRVSGRSLQLSSIPDWDAVHRFRDLRRLDARLGHASPHWQAALDHPTVDAYWQKLAITGYERMDWPVLHVTGWYDPCAPGTLHQPVAETTPLETRFRSSADYPPKHIADKVRSSRSAPEGERQQATVLFADLEGSPRQP